MTFANLALLWDMDGTLIDSYDCHFSTWQSTLEKKAIRLDRDVFDANFGRKNQAVLPLYLGFDPDPELMDRLITEKETLFCQRVPQEADLIPGVIGWLSTAQAHGIPQVIASSAMLSNIQSLTTSFRLSPYFDHYVSGADLPAKPEPDIFLKAAAILNMPPARCLVIEDSPAGVRAAKRAGMKCVAVTSTYSPQALSEADLVLPDFTRPIEEALAALAMI